MARVKPSRSWGGGFPEERRPQGRGRRAPTDGFMAIPEGNLPPQPHCSAVQDFTPSKSENDTPECASRVGGAILRPPGVETRIQPESFFFSSSLTCAGLALPLEAFITWPTKKPSNLSLPARYCSS